MRCAICAVVLLAIAGCGDGSLVDAEVDPQVTDSLNPEISPVLDLSAPISILGANAQ